MSRRKRKEGPAVCPDFSHPVLPDPLLPKVAVEAHSAWNFHTLDKGGPRATTVSQVSPHLERLVSSCEGRTLVGCCQQRHCHPVCVTSDGLSVKARNRLKGMPEVGEWLFQLSLGEKRRLFGYMIRNVFCALWLDEKHEVWPCGG
jgi:hypothetical protein